MGRAMRAPATMTRKEAAREATGALASHGRPTAECACVFTLCGMGREWAARSRAAC